MTPILIESSDSTVCSGDANITIQSCDNVHFRIHLVNLKASSTGLSPPGDCSTVSFEEVVHLTEPASVLEPLFQFMYPQAHPDLEAMDYGTLELLAEAAEKYEVYPAMNICKIVMR